MMKHTLLGFTVMMLIILLAVGGKLPDILIRIHAGTGLIAVLWIIYLECYKKENMPKYNKRIYRCRR